MNEEIQASPELQKFFVRLLALKEYTRGCSESLGLNCLNYIYRELEEIIKEKE